MPVQLLLALDLPGGLLLGGPGGFALLAAQLFRSLGRLRLRFRGRKLPDYGVESRILRVNLWQTGGLEGHRALLGHGSGLRLRLGLGRGRLLRLRRVPVRLTAAEFPDNILQSKFFHGFVFGLHTVPSRLRLAAALADGLIE